jgi:hypothetical protein
MPRYNSRVTFRKQVAPAVTHKSANWAPGKGLGPVKRAGGEQMSCIFLHN